MKMSKKTGMAKLRHEKKRLKAQMEIEKSEIFVEVEKYKNSLWPFKIVARFRKTAESLSENKLLILGAQLAYAAINTMKEKKENGKEGSDESKGGVKEFLKNLANNFLKEFIGKKDQAEE
jgi:hypothetical protein